MALASLIMNSEKLGSFPFLSSRERSHESTFPMLVLDVALASLIMDSEKLGCVIDMGIQEGTPRP
jgi:hypothetical protein